jgi:uncharacterized membrane protein YccC
MTTEIPPEEEQAFQEWLQQTKHKIHLITDQLEALLKLAVQTARTIAGCQRCQRLEEALEEANDKLATVEALGRDLEEAQEAVEDCQLKFEELDLAEVEVNEPDPGVAHGQAQ